MGGLKLCLNPLSNELSTKPPRNMGGLKLKNNISLDKKCTKPPRNMGGLKPTTIYNRELYVQNPLEIWGV